VVAQSMLHMVFDHSNTGIVGSNPAQDMDVCQRFSVLCSPVLVYRVCNRLIPHPRCPTKMSIGFIVTEVNSELEEARGLNL